MVKLSLSQFWLENTEGKLYPAEQKLLAACQTGDACQVGGREDAPRPEQVGADNKVRAEFLRYILLGGCDACAVHPRGISLRGAFIVCAEQASGNRELDLSAARIPYDFSLINCTLEGDVNLQGSSTGTMQFSGTGIGSFKSSQLRVHGSVLLNDSFHATGDVLLSTAKIEGRLDCSDGRFDGLLDCHECVISKGVYLRSCDTKMSKEFIAHGTVNFANANIMGNLQCEKGRFLCKDQAVFANRAKIGGDVSFDEARMVGTVGLNGADIGGGLSFNGTKLSGKPSLQLRGGNIAGTFFWRELRAVEGDVDLAGANCNTMSFDRKSWFREFEKSEAKSADTSKTAKAENEKPAKLPSTKLDNFTYNGFSNPPEKANGKFWIEWLGVQPVDHLSNKFRPKPWSQLAQVLDTMGFEGEAKKIRVEREWLLTRFMAHHDPENSSASYFSFNWLRVMWRRIWGLTIDFGYQPMKALLFLTVIIFAGGGVYWWAAHQGIMAPTHPLIYKEARLNAAGKAGAIDEICAENWVYFKHENCSAQMPAEYSEFMALMYSADVALPIINLRQQEDWSPRVVDHTGKPILSGHLVRWWEWTVTVLGWILSLMFVSAVGGFIRR